MVTISLGMVLSMMAALDEAGARQPSARRVAEAIVDVVGSSEPVFGSSSADASVLVEVAYRESRWMPNRTGDNHRSLCEYQLQGVPIRVLWDLPLCTRIAYDRLRQSAKGCPDAPLALYASGSCGNRTARAISRSRLAEASRIEEAAISACDRQD